MKCKGAQSKDDGIFVKALCLVNKLDYFAAGDQRVKGDRNCNQRDDFYRPGQHLVVFFPALAFGVSRKVGQDYRSDGDGKDSQNQFLQAQRVLEAGDDARSGAAGKRGAYHVVDLVACHSDNRRNDKGDNLARSRIGKGFLQADKADGPAGLCHKGKLKGGLRDSSDQNSDRHRAGRVFHFARKDIRSKNNAEIKKNRRKARGQKYFFAVKDSLKAGRDRNHEQVGEHNACKEGGFGNQRRFLALKENADDYRRGQDSKAYDARGQEGN